MMHIGVDARLTFYRRGGISVYIAQLVAALEALDGENRFTVFHSRRMRESLVSRFERRSLWTPPHHRFERVALSAELLPHRLDVFHATDFIPPLAGAKRFVASVHDLAFLHYPQFLTDESRRYYNDQIAEAVARADHILTISESSKRDIMAMLGVPASRVTVHLPGVDARFRPQPDDVIRACRRAAALPDAYFLFVGTFEPRKNLAGLARAYRRLVDQDTQAPALVMAGTSGWQFESVRAEIDRLQLGDRLLWREGIPQDLLPALYSGAVALVLPSFYEGFGIPPLEAMACGTLPIVSSVSALPEVVGEVGLLVDPHDDEALTDALRRAWRDDRWRAEQEWAGIGRAAQFTWERAAQIALSVYTGSL